MLKKIWTSVPQLSLLILILALLKLLLYYNNFNVPIKYFIGLTELGLLIADDLFITLSLIIFAYFIITFKIGTKKETQEEGSLVSDKKNTSQTTESKKGKILDRIMPFIGVGIFILMMVVVPIFIIFNASSYSEQILGASMLAVVFFYFIYITKYEKLEKYFTSQVMGLFLFIPLFLLIFFSQTSGEIQSVESGAYIGTKIVTVDSTYTSTDTAYYIGQTTNYIFFYNQKDKHTTILPMDEVKKLELYRK